MAIREGDPRSTTSSSQKATFETKKIVPTKANKDLLGFFMLMPTVLV